MQILESLYGSLNAFPGVLTILGVIAVFSLLGYTGASFWLWILAGAAAFVGFGAPMWAWAVLGVFAVLFGVPLIRRVILTSSIVKTVNALKLMPTISDTERTAIEAGNIWVDGELFSGKPDWKRLMNESYPDLTPDEKAFLDGPVEEVCKMTKDWEVFQQKDLPADVWEYLKKNRFFGLITPKKYGGLEFSPSANSAIVVKLIARSGPLGTTVMVPSSLGPAELLMHYGTEEQKEYYLPRLASGEEMPCFALTEANAGSDAGNLSSRGAVFKGDDGELYLRLNWKKRYITLAPIATVVGLAFQLEDPENYLGKGKRPGITCALVPADTPGVVNNMRHDPIGVPFFNGPTEGHDVVVPINAIIGGPEQAGNGWRMLVESLAVGRGISLPASGAGGAQAMARSGGAYAKIRKQFGLSIGKFEGIEEPLARIGGFAYLLEAARRYTCGGLDRGEKPAVITAIAKYNFTEIFRKAINDCMDILGGAAIMRGPRNIIANGYIAVPINITVEGANILTRTLMVFGQGAIRCHPYAFKEIDALMNNDIKAFDSVFWKHIGHVIRNFFRTVILSLTRGYIGGAHRNGPTAKYFRRLTWASASFALLADIAMGLYGGNLKRMEKITGRFADIFSWLYLGTAVLRRFEAEGSRKEDLPFVHWSLQFSLSQIQNGFDGIYQNMGAFFRGPIALWSRLNTLGNMPSDKIGSQVAQALQVPGEQRDRISSGVFVSEDMTETAAKLENALALVHESEPIFKKVVKAVRAKKIAKGAAKQMVAAAVEAGIITSEEAEILAKTEAARDDVVQVDTFTQEEYLNIPGAPGRRRKTIQREQETILSS